MPVLFSCGLVDAVRATDAVLAGTGSSTHTCTDCPKRPGNCKVRTVVAVKRSLLSPLQQQGFDRNLKEKNGWVLHPDFK